MLRSQITTIFGCTEAQIDYTAGNNSCSVMYTTAVGIASLPHGVKMHQASRQGRIDSHSFRAYPAFCQRDFMGRDTVGSKAKHNSKFQKVSFVLSSRVRDEVRTVRFVWSDIEKGGSPP